MILRKNSRLVFEYYYFLKVSSSKSCKKTVLLFGGQGNQEKGMLDKFLINQKAFNLIKEQSQKLKVDLLQIATTDNKNLINITKYTQPLLLLSQYLQLFYSQPKVDLSRQEYFKTYCIGHSLGEYTSLVVSESISLQQCLKLVYLRGDLMIKSSEGQNQLGTLIIKFREDKLPNILEQVQRLKLEVSCYNSPTNIVVSGQITALNELKNFMKQQLRIVSKVLPAATAFHSSYLQKMKDPYKQILNSVDFKQPKFQVVRNVDCKIYRDKADIAEGLSMQNSKAVLFRQSVEKLIEKQGKQNIEFIQVGHKEYLRRWVDEVIKLY